MIKPDNYVMFFFIVVQFVVNLYSLVRIYTSLFERIAIIETKLNYLQNTVDRRDTHNAREN